MSKPTYVEFGKDNWVTVEYFLEHMDDNKKNIFGMLKYLERTESEFVLKLSHVRKFTGQVWQGYHFILIEHSNESSKDIRFIEDWGWDQKMVRELLKFKDIDLKLEGLVLEHV
jgi:hypothetical protein